MTRLSTVQRRTLFRAGRDPLGVIEPPLVVGQALVRRGYADWLGLGPRAIRLNARGRTFVRTGVE